MKKLKTTEELAAMVGDNGEDTKYASEAGVLRALVGMLVSDIENAIEYFEDENAPAAIKVLKGSLHSMEDYMK